jgi:hypothetical protein
VGEPQYVPSASGGVTTTIKVLLVPSWVAGLCAALMGVDLVFHVFEEPFSQLIGNTVLIDGFLIAPLTMVIAVGLATWHSVRRRKSAAALPSEQGPKHWRLIGLSFLCIVGAWVMMATIFRS